MNRNKVQIAHGSLALLIELMGFQMVNVALGLFGVIYDHSFITGLSSLTQLLIYAGIAISVLVFSILAVLLFCPSAACRRKTIVRVPRISKRSGSIRECLKE